MSYEIKQDGKFRYIEEGQGEPLLELDLLHTSVGGLEKFVFKFIEQRNLNNINLLGNSLGGHVAILHVLKHPERIKSLILTVSSGLFENGMGDTYPKRGDYDYIKKKTELTFYDPQIATKELVDEVYEIVNNRLKAVKIIALATSYIYQTLGGAYAIISSHFGYT